MGQRASFGIGQFNSFWSYTTPIIGAIIADEYLGRFNTIFIAIAFSILGHILLIISAIPAVLTSGNAIAPFILGVITLGFGTGAFKANISPLIAEQYRQTKPRVIIEPKTGERVISDPNITISRIFCKYHPSAECCVGWMLVIERSFEKSPLGDISTQHHPQWFKTL
jgi:POT family proton-dependent oligopeptide transporter